jgi:uncharacterized membrane protein YfcA
VSVSLLLVLSACILVMAILYSSVGMAAHPVHRHLGLFSLAPRRLQADRVGPEHPGVGDRHHLFLARGHFSWHLFWPFAATSIPFSFLGGYLRMPTHVYQPHGDRAAGLRLPPFPGRIAKPGSFRPSITAALMVGAVLGFLSGLTGVGGGIFLSHLLLLLGWARVKEVSAVAALFILVNSTAGLLRHIGSLQTMPRYVPILAVAALAGGITGSFLGSSRIPASGLVRALSVVLIIAGFKLLFV